MSGLIRAELLKVRTTQSVYWLLALTVALVGVFVSVSTWSLTRSLSGADDSLTLTTEQSLRLILSNASGNFAGPIALLCLGALILAGEYRHNTITPTLLAAPRRATLVAAKLTTTVLLAVAFSVVATAVTLAIALPWLGSAGVEVNLADREALLVLLGNTLALILWGLIGFGVGALLRNSLIAVVVLLVWMLVIEQILSFALLAAPWEWLHALWKFLPSSAAQALQRVFVPDTGEGGQAIPFDFDFLPMWGGGLVMLGYALFFCALGLAFSIRRDVT